jgi:pimeloyl-ACP methyl ester carboxylesterase
MVSLASRLESADVGRIAQDSPMIARIQLSMLIGQMLLAMLLAAWLAMSGRLPVPLAALVGAMVPLSIHAFVLGLDFLLAWAVRAERPHASLLRGSWLWLRAWVLEIIDSMRTFSIAQPLLHRRPLASADARSATAKLPVLLIHGFFCNQALWLPLARRLAAAGHATAAVNLEPPHASIDDYLPQVDKAVADLRQRTGAQEVALVCHSMGGLVARAYLRGRGDSGIASVVTLGTPHRGTVHARFARGTNVGQMRRDSRWLQQLAVDEPPERLARFSVIRTWQDNIVAPQGDQTLPGATTIDFEGVGHVGLVYHRVVGDAVIAALTRGAAPGATAPRPPVARHDPLANAKTRPAC